MDSQDIAVPLGVGCRAIGMGCSVNADCYSNTTCQGGKCVGMSVNQTCRNDYECNAGLYCDPTRMICTALAPNGATVTDSNYCQSWFTNGTLNGGTCANVFDYLYLTPDGAACDPNFNCQQCSASSYCDLTNKTCMPLKSPACNITNRCSQNDYTSAGSCSCFADGTCYTPSCSESTSVWSWKESAIVHQKCPQEPSAGTPGCNAPQDWQDATGGDPTQWTGSCYYSHENCLNEQSASCSLNIYQAAGLPNSFCGFSVSSVSTGACSDAAHVTIGVVSVILSVISLLFI